ncbi:MAG: hypothetical protein ACI4PF_02830 [Christensenellales bacterium]
MAKKFVRVLVDTNECGEKTPKLLIYNDIKYEIDKVMDIRNCASFKAGGFGERYTIRIGNNTTYLFYENGRWFVEEK